MAAPLQLTITDYKDEAHWRWVLADDKGNFIADHEVALDAYAPEYRGFKDLPGYLDYYTPAKTEEQLLHELGEWIGTQVFGKLTGALSKHKHHPATVVMVSVPDKAQDLLFRPFELAHLDGQPFAERGVRFVYQSPSPAAKRVGEGKGVGAALRVLAVFSLPTDANPLNLRRERYMLQHRLKQIAQMHGLAIDDVHILQYGATRKTLEDALQDGQGWDVIHFSGHGLEGELVLENERGEAALIKAEDLKPLLQLAKDRLKLLTLSACLSGAGSLQAARAQLGLQAAPTSTPSTPQTTLPSLAQQLAQELDCAALAMRYAVGDEFSINLMLSLYGLMLEKGQPLPGALQLALGQALSGERREAAPPLSLVTPILFGPRAADLTLAPPKRTPSFELPQTGLLNFPPEPERFVGRLKPMLRASQALAPGSECRGVLFYGMAGAGKTACALELAYRHEQDRFARGCVWHKAPDEDKESDHQIEFASFLLDIEAQLNLHDDLTAYADDPVNFERRTLPRLKKMLSDNAILIVLDNIESLLTSTGAWRDAKWGKLIEALLGHTGTSRLALTSRRLPVALQNHPALASVSVHTLSFGESVLLARELPNLRKLFRDNQGIALLLRVLRIVQGHPKLLELADRMAADLAMLERQLAQAESEAAGRDALLRAFFDTNQTKLGEENFVATLHDWTTGLLATLPPTARLLFHFLCRLEEHDRESSFFEPVWPQFLKRLADVQSSDDSGVAVAALDATDQGLGPSLDLLVNTGLIESLSLSVSQPESRFQSSSFRLHPSVVEVGLTQANPATLDAVDIEMGDFWVFMSQLGQVNELQGSGSLIVESGLRAAPYLIRVKRWDEASMMLENVIQRDTAPVTLMMVLPLLRRIAEATKGTDRGLTHVAVLVNALLKAGHYAEAEQIGHDLLVECLAHGKHRLASTVGGDLFNVFLLTGQLERASRLIEQKADYTRRAGLGPWTQLADECQTLQILNAQGHYDQVLEVVQHLRGQLATLPEESEFEESANVWNVREVLLDAGCSAAIGEKQWEVALALNAEIFKFQQQRGADQMTLARTRLKDYGPLLELHHLDEARMLLKDCRAVFEQAHAIDEVSMVFSDLARLEVLEGHFEQGVEFEKIALKYTYQIGRPEHRAMSHGNLATHFEYAQCEPSLVLAHRLAASLLFFQTDSGSLTKSINLLANSALPAVPPTFEQVATTVEQIEGVKFRDLFACLPTRAPNGDAAIAAVWEMVKEAKSKT